MGDVVNFGGVTRLDLPVDTILEGAKGRVTDGVIVIGYDSDGDMYFASSMADGGTALWLLEQCKLSLMLGTCEE